MSDKLPAPPAAAVHALVQARRSRIATPAAAVPLPDVNAAYAAQAAVGDALGWFQRTGRMHWKSGGPSRDAVPTHAALPPEGVWASPADARHWPFRLRGIEAEVALRIRQDVDAAAADQLDLDGARALVDAMCVAIEVVDSRWTEGLDAPPLAKLADLQSHGALVLGTWMPFEPGDWATQVCRVTVGAGPEVERRGTHALADPAFVLPAWLRHATRSGNVVRAGTVVTTGTWCGILHAAAGDRVRIDFPGIGRAEMQL